MTKSSPDSRASSPSPPRSPSPTVRAARCATAASTSRTSSATCRSSRSGACWSTARSSPGLPPAEPHPLAVRSGDPRVDVQAALAMLAPEWGLRPLIDISDEQARDDLARASVMALSFVAQSARGVGRPPVPQREVDRAGSIAERFLIRWRGEADPDHVKAIDAYWISAAEHGMNASTFTARVVASTGADVAAALSARVGALSRPAARRRARARAEDARRGRARPATPTAGSSDVLDRGERLMGFGHRVYRAEDPRARVLRRTAGESARRASRSPRRSSGGARRAQRAQARPRAGHQRRVLVGRGARPRAGAAGAVHAAVHVRARRPAGRRTSSSRSARAG